MGVSGIPQSKGNGASDWNQENSQPKEVCATFGRGKDIYSSSSPSDEQEIFDKNYGGPDQAAQQPQEFIQWNACHAERGKQSSAHEPTVVVGKQVPEDVQPNAEKQGEQYLDERNWAPRAEGESYVQVGIRKRRK